MNDEAGVEVIGSPAEEQRRGPGRPRREAAPVGKATPLSDPIPGAKRRKRVNESARQILPDTSRLDPNYKYRAVTDIHNNIQTLIDRGYEIVQSDSALVDEEAGKATGLNSQVQFIANPTTGGERGVLMRIPKELAEEDQADKQRLVDQAEERIYAEAKKVQGAYTPGSKDGPVGPNIQR